jgi:ABC-type polysaccharide/polyol phosphate transport system ATPase subunit
MADSSVAISVDHVSKMFRLYHEKNQYLKSALLSGKRAKYEDFWAVNDVSFEVSTGSTFGIIGSNGSGKSTLLKCIAGILTPEKGSIETRGRTAALLELGSGFHPDLSGRENVFLNGALLGLSRGELEKKFDEIIDFAGIEEFIDTPVRNYSSGMAVRLGFAIAINVDPEILIIDEVLAVGDASFQQKCYQKIESFRRDGKTILFVSHGLGDVTTLCSQVLWMEKGHARAVGRSIDLVSDYLGASHNTVHKTNETTGERWGNEEFTVEKVEVLNHDKQSTDVVHTGREMTIRIHYKRNSSVDDVIAGLRISHLHGTQVFATNSRRRESDLGRFGNTGYVDLVIPRVPMLAGTFQISVDLSDASELYTYDHWGQCFTFDVLQDTVQDEGLVTIDATWSSTSTS